MFNKKGRFFQIFKQTLDRLISEKRTAGQYNDIIISKRELFLRDELL